MAEEERTQLDVERENRHRRILEVARRHFERYDYKRTVIDDIVQEVGIAKGTFYLHFSSKRELLLAVIDDIQRQSLLVFQELVKKELTPGELMREMLEWVAKVMMEQPLAERLLILDSDHWIVREIMTREDMQQQLQVSLSFFRNLVKEGIDAGEFRPEVDLEVAPFLFGAAKVLFANREMATQGLIDIDKFIQGIIEMVMRYLTAPGVKIGENKSARRSRLYDLVGSSAGADVARTNE